MTDYPGYPVFFRCKVCKRIFRPVETPTGPRYVPVSSEEAVAVTLAGLVDPRKAFCADMCDGSDLRYIWIEESTNEIKSI